MDNIIIVLGEYLGIFFMLMLKFIFITLAVYTGIKLYYKTTKK